MLPWWLPWVAVMNNSLLPPSASAFMRHSETPAQRLTGIPVDLNRLWNPDTCPVALLPYLAWALSVDRWDRNWAESTKRQVVKAAWQVHRRKGTIAALRTVVEPFGYLIHVTEWWQNGGERGTFQLDIGVSEAGISDETYQELERLIADAKPCSRHMTGLAINLQTSGEAYCHAGCYGGDVMTVYPWMPSAVEVCGSHYGGAATHIIDTLEVTNGG